MATTKQTATPKPPAIPTVSDAERVIADLEKQRAILLEERAADDTDMSRIAYAAHAHHDPEATRQLDEVTERVIRHEQRLKEVAAALETAKRVLAQAQAVEARKAERAKAGELKAAFERLKLAARMLDDALAVLVEAGDEIHTAVDTLHVAGWDHPTGQQALSFGERAIRTAIMQTMWSRCVERLAPNERVSFSHVVSQWQQVFERRLGELQKEEAA